jgi:serine/threonine protein kinase
MPVTNPRLSNWDVGSLVGGKYQLRRLLGSGAMGAVYEARHVRTGKKVAIKVLSPEMASNRETEARFFQEARAAGAIEHENVVDIYDVDTDGGAPFIVMELLRGESLGAFLERRGRLGVDEALQVIVPALEGIEAAHRDGIVHRDLKPDNIFLCRDRNGRFMRSKVLDFGISRVATPADGSHLRMTVDGTLMGTPLYMAPEQLQSATAVDPRTDVYAMGCVLFEMLTGRPPFVSENVAEIFIQIATCEPPDPCAHRPELPRAVGDVVGRALAKEPSARFESMRELARALLVAREGGVEGPSDDMVAATLVADRDDLMKTSPDRPVVTSPREDDDAETSFFDRTSTSAEMEALRAASKDSADTSRDLNEMMARLASSSTTALDDLESSALAWGYGGDDETGAIDIRRVVEPPARSGTRVSLGASEGPDPIEHHASSGAQHAVAPEDGSPLVLPTHGARPVVVGIAITAMVLAGVGFVSVSGDSEISATPATASPAVVTEAPASTPSSSRPTSSLVPEAAPEPTNARDDSLPSGVEPPPLSPEPPSSDADDAPAMRSTVASAASPSNTPSQMTSSTRSEARTPEPAREASNRPVERPATPTAPSTTTPPPATTAMAPPAPTVEPAATRAAGRLGAASSIDDF